MESAKIFNMFFEVIGGLGIFLYGMRHMSDGLQAVAGERLRKMINAVTDNRFIACAVGVLVTCIVQSSSITTVMVVGMVNASLMTLSQAVGVILGANIGTTITGWILVVKIGKYGLPMAGSAAIIYLFTKSEKTRSISKFFLGLGMIFFGLSLMSNGFKPMRTMPQFVEWFHAFQPDNFYGILKCVAAGAILTGIIQSSSATLGITIGLAVTGVISYEAAVALVLGENIGTTITARLASIGASDNAKRASWAHVLVNVLGVGMMVLIFPWFVDFVKTLTGIDPLKSEMIDGSLNFVDVTLGIATSHTMFNVAMVILYLPLLTYIVKLLYWIVPLREEGPVHLTYLDVRLIEAPALAIEQSHKAVLRMGEQALAMMGSLRSCWEAKDHDEKKEIDVFEKEQGMDLMQKETVDFVSEILQNSVAEDVVAEGRHQLRGADELESIGDYIERILKLKLKLLQADVAFAEKPMAEILDLHDHCTVYLKMVIKTLENKDRGALVKAQVDGDNITHLIKEYRARHLQRLELKETSPFKSLVYQDVLNGYRRIKDHALNLIEALAGEK